MKALFVGLGSIGQRHLRNLKKLMPEVEVHAVRRKRSVPFLDHHNRVVDKKDLKEEYGLTAHASIENAVEISPDLVFITNPSNMHASDTKYVLRNSNAYIFVEKPVSHELSQLKELIEIEKKGRRRVMVGFQFRFSPMLQRVKSILSDAEIGDIVGAAFTNGEYMPGWHPYEDYRNSYASRNDLGGGALLTQIHDIDYSTWLLGAPIRLTAFGGKLSRLDIDVEDSVKVLMVCDPDSSGKTVPVSISLDYLRKPAKKSFEIIGERGQVHCDILSSLLTVNKEKSLSKVIFDYNSFERNEMFLEQLKAFLRFADNGEDPPVGLDEAIISLKMVSASKYSMLNGEAVEFNEQCSSK